MWVMHWNRQHALHAKRRTATSNEWQMLLYLTAKRESNIYFIHFASFASHAEANSMGFLCVEFPWTAGSTLIE